MKKTLLITVDFPPRIGGVSHYLGELCKRLPKDKIVVLAPSEKDYQEFDCHQSYKIYRKKLITTFPFIWPKWLFLIRTVKQIIRKENIDHILVGQILPIGTVAFFINKLWKIPYILSTHAMDITILKTSLRKTQLAKKILFTSQKIVTVSKFTHNELVRLGAEKEKIVIISPATDILNAKYPDNQEEIKKRYDLNDKKILLTIGRLVERKGHLQVLKSLSRVLEQFPNTVYIIGSAGPYENVLKDYVRKNNLEKNVILTGVIPKNEISSYYKLADIFIMPTTKLKDGDVEGFGIVYLEANAFAKPVIASQYGGVEDAVIHNETGLIINPENTNEISHAIIQLLKDGGFAKKLGEQGKNRVIKQFNWETRADQLEKVLS